MLGVGLCALPVSTWSAEKPAPPAKEQAPPKGNFRPFNGTIKKITKESLVLEGEAAQTFAITGRTKIAKDGKPASVSDLKAGDKVGGRAEEKNGQWEALVVNAGIRPRKAPEKTEKK
jgi:hypothetical protein